MAGAGEAIFFVLSLVALVIVGTYTFAFAAHSFFTVVVGTAAGENEVRWPDEPMIDWLWQAVYLAWLIGVWLAPAILVGQMMVGESPRGPWALAIVTVILFWLLFPIGLLSSMSASSRWAILSPTILPALAKRTGSLVLFYFFTGPVIGAATAGGWLAVTAQSHWLIPVGALIVSAAVLIYARFLGRLAQMVRLTIERAPAATDDVGGPTTDRPRRRRSAKKPRPRPAAEARLKGEPRGCAMTTSRSRRDRRHAGRSTSTTNPMTCVPRMPIRRRAAYPRASGSRRSWKWNWPVGAARWNSPTTRGPAGRSRSRSTPTALAHCCG